tara:strand:+ start:432 stop:941 length:510 start_codon:yes stop_codon:yes gene_type:complete
MNEIKMRDMNTEEKRMLYVETMLPDCPEGNPLIEQVLSSIEGHEERITSLVIHDGFDNNGLPRVVVIGDCPCGGAKCRAGWQWIYKARDLDMQGHRGSLWAVACEDAPIVFNAETGDALPLPPMGMNADEWSRYQTSSWGNVTKLDAATLSEFNLATAEGRNNSWKVDN